MEAQPSIGSSNDRRFDFEYFLLSEFDSPDTNPEVNPIKAFASTMNREFWTGKRVLLTGHTGFKGSWLALWLQALGAETIGYSLPPPTQPSLFELAQVANGMTSITGDIRDFEFLKRVNLTSVTRALDDRRFWWQAVERGM